MSDFIYNFFKFFSADLKFFLVSAANYAFEIKSLPQSQSRGVISIIPKGNKRKDLLENWRLLCILNVFYNLVSGVITSWINSVLDIINLALYLTDILGIACAQRMMSCLGPKLTIKQACFS